MMKKRFLLFFLLGFIMNIGSQNNTIPYEYVIVPLQYDFLKSKDKYRLNTLTRYLLREDGFKVYFGEGETLPQDLFEDRCLAMYADVQKVKGGFLKTKLKISFKDCYGHVILESKEGVTKEKEYNIAYKDALRKAYASLDFSKIENKTTPQEVAPTPAPPPAPKIADIDEEEVQEDIELVEEVEESPQDEDIKTQETLEDILYAQPIANGFQLVDTTPKKVMILLKTAKPDVFKVKGKDAIVYKDNGKWIYSETTEEGLNSYTLNIKF